MVESQTGIKKGNLMMFKYPRIKVWGWWAPRLDAGLIFVCEWKRIKISPKTKK